MIEDFQAGRIQTNEQATERAIAISRSINGEDWEKTGWPTNCTDAEGNLVFISDINSIYDLYSALAKNGPIYGQYWNNSIREGHLVVITGVNLTQGIVYTNNPWYFAGEQTYSEFLSGVAWHHSTSGMPFCAYVKII